MRHLAAARPLAAGFAVLAAAALLLIAPAARPAEAAGRSVAMSGYAFGPATLTVDAGDTVTWTNHDTAPHDVKTTSGPVALHSPMLAKGSTWTYRFSVPGTYRYYCTVHPDMLATLVVKAAPAGAPPTTAAHAYTHPSHASPPAARLSGAATAAHGHGAAPRTGAASPPPPAGTDPAMPMPTPAPSSASQTAPPVAAAPAADARPLRPLLVLTGAVTGVAVVCLLLVGSRARRTGGG